MKAPEITRRTAITGLGAATIGIASAHSGLAAEPDQRPLLVPLGLTWVDPDIITAGIGETGRLLVTGGIPHLWLGRELVATAPVEPWRVPGAMSIDEAFAQPGPPRGRPLAIIVGDLAHPQWIDVALEVAVGARSAGRYVVAANAWLGPGAIPSGDLRHRLEQLCDCIIADPEIPAEMAIDMDPHDRAILTVPAIEAIAGAASQLGGRAVAARLAPGFYRAESRRLSWPARPPTDPDELLRACAGTPAMQVLHIPYLLPARISRQIVTLIRKLPNRRDTLTMIARHVGAADGDRPFDVILRQLVRMG